MSNNDITLKEELNKPNLIKEWLMEKFKLTNPTHVLELVKICEASNLNPFNGEVYVIAYKGQPSIFTNYQVYNARAASSGLLEWGPEIEVFYKKDEKGNIVVGPTGQPIILYGEFRAKRKDRAKEFKKTFWFKEWTQNQSLWLTKPVFMFEKVMLSVGLRELLPEVLGMLPYLVEEQWRGCSEVKPIEAPTQEVVKEELKKNESIFN